MGVGVVKVGIREKFRLSQIQWTDTWYFIFYFYIT